MEHSAATGSLCAFSSCLSTGTEDCAVPVVLSSWLTICFVLSTSDELSPAWLLTLTESDCTVVLQQKCDNATLIIFISTTTTCIPSHQDFSCGLTETPRDCWEASLALTYGVDQFSQWVCMHTQNVSRSFLAPCTLCAPPLRNPQETQRDCWEVIKRIRVFGDNALYKSTFYLLTYLLIVFSSDLWVGSPHPAGGAACFKHGGGAVYVRITKRSWLYTDREGRRERWSQTAPWTRHSHSDKCRCRHRAAGSADPPALRSTSPTDHLLPPQPPPLTMTSRRSSRWRHCEATWWREAAWRPDTSRSASLSAERRRLRWASCLRGRRCTNQTAELKYLTLDNRGTLDCDVIALWTLNTNWLIFIKVHVTNVHAQTVMTKWQNNI